MEEDNTLKQLVAEQMKPEAADDEIPPAPPVVAQALSPVLAPPVPAPTVVAGPTVPDFRGKSMRAVVEKASAAGIDVMVEGSGVARAQLPLPGTPLRAGEKIRVVFAR
jgi:hypothetical protein